MWLIEPLQRAHHRDDFDCGTPELNEFLKKYARQNAKLEISRTYVAVNPGQLEVLGYYTLRAGEISCRDLPKDESKKLPRYPVPIVHLARLAVHRGESGKGLGEFLLVDGLGRSLRASKEVGAFAMEVIAKNDSAKRFYEKYGFRELADDKRHLYLSMKKLKKLFHQS
ncbi:MAG: N-acetyltransferase [Acidobacteria bacterium]|nr:MAG: N-acetyltransferase [Acidobacteriota bacterium]